MTTAGAYGSEREAGTGTGENTVKSPWDSWPQQIRGGRCDCHQRRPERYVGLRREQSDPTCRDMELDALLAEHTARWAQVVEYAGALNVSCYQAGLNPVQADHVIGAFVQGALHM